MLIDGGPAPLVEVKLCCRPGRVDAFGRLANKVALFVKNRPLTGSPPFAPVSYPHLWNSHRQARNQWNGLALNFITRDKIRPHADPGELTRNAGQVIGGGGKAYDVGKVGFVNKRTSHGRMFLYRTRDKGSRLIAGNANVSHEYGAHSLSDTGRLDLLEYPKSL